MPHSDAGTLVLGISLGAQLLAAVLGGRVYPETDVCPNQAFELGPALALQFHLEVQPQGVAELAHACGHELSGGRYVQNREQFLDAEAHCRTVEPLLFSMLDRL